MQPHFRLQSLTVKTMVVNGKTVHRHFFKWHERRDLGIFFLRLLLVRQDGTTIGSQHKLKFPKIKLLGEAEIEEEGVKVTIPRYNASTNFYVDADEIAVGFDYYTATVTRKSEPVLELISLKREDLRLVEEKLLPQKE
ncbi:hypothetical protein [Spirosoma oryzicola]|uniref:hypothetical protein n=1 Tax=Spirosoma oryzicola TaxID=2898794 RepID=UPI001E33938F|nr:hypothetical protein [Spirosoma oryzicola]UHG91781.1 hypothetical protein LQ777_02520 [Spirosoma oryzicola]